MTTSSAIIAKFGGSGHLAEISGWSQSRISNWHQTGIPRARFAELVKLASSRKIRGVTLDVLLAHTPGHLYRAAQDGKGKTNGTGS